MDTEYYEGFIITRLYSGNVSRTREELAVSKFCVYKLLTGFFNDEAHALLLFLGSILQVFIFLRVIFVQVLPLWFLIARNLWFLTRRSLLCLTSPSTPTSTATLTPTGCRAASCPLKNTQLSAGYELSIFSVMELLLGSVRNVMFGKLLIRNLGLLCLSACDAWANLRACDALRHYRLILKDALRHYRLIADDALRHFSLGVLDIPVLGRFPA